MLDEATRIRVRAAEACGDAIVKLQSSIDAAVRSFEELRDQLEKTDGVITVLGELTAVGGAVASSISTPPMPRL